MASVNFLYRSTKSQGPLTARLLFRDKKDFVFAAKTELIVTQDYWKNQHSKASRDIEIRNKQSDINSELNNIENHILNSFYKATPQEINKDWLKKVIDLYYHPELEGNSKDIPQNLIDFIDFYLESKKNEIQSKGARRINVTKHKLQRMEIYTGKKNLIKNINEDFKQKFVAFSNHEFYSPNTQQRELVLIKTLCYYAKYLGLETHHQLESLKLKRQSVNHVYLTFEEINTIKQLKLPHDHLENARDWLLISCYTGQRVSDFMRFSRTMIRIEDEKFLLEFRQQKTQKLMTIPISKEVREVLSKRNGKFPRPISGQKYNDYIKEVCRTAGITELTEGKKRLNITSDDKKATYRDVIGKYEKCELVSSHVGRRSFATNYYGIVPTSYLINITGHGSEKMFLNYIKKSNKDLAIDAYDYFN